MVLHDYKKIVILLLVFTSVSNAFWRRTRRRRAQPSPPAVRLANGPNRYSGRVEVSFGGTWGTVCDDLWGINDANVVCRQLGFTRASSAESNARYGEGGGPIHMDDVSCGGSETRLWDCEYVGSSGENCGHHEDAGVRCRPQGHIRLADGSNRYSGRVEVYLDGSWGTVCDDSWDINDAHVVCRQLGFSSASYAHSSAYYGQGDGSIHMDNVECGGSESSLFDCEFVDSSRENCVHSEDAGVRCRTQGHIRLADGPNRYSGRVEVYLDGSWGTVCDDSWDIVDANVVCRQLGFSRASYAHSSAYYGQGDGSIHMDNVECGGSESILFDCEFLDSLRENCVHSEDAGVRCRPQGQLRLAGGNSYSGRVEVLLGGSWGTVCDDSWGIDDANVVCRQLGFSSASSADSNAVYGEGEGPIQMDDVACEGSESSLFDCRFVDSSGENCGHHEDAGVTCRIQAAQQDQESTDLGSRTVVDAVSALDFFAARNWIPSNGSASVDLDTLITMFQRYANIPVTGVLDQTTLDKMNSPKCGNPDFGSEGFPIARFTGFRRKRFARFGNPWLRNHLTWFLEGITSDLPRSVIKREIAAAFQHWENVSPLRFSEVSSRNADIIVNFYRGYHGDGYSFDGPGKVLAHAFHPGGGIFGDIHFDDAETFTTGGSGFNLQQIAVHEIGHSLGLGHSMDRNAIMWPYYEYRENFQLGSDDIAGIQAVYDGITLISCPDNMVHGACSCGQRSCQEPNVCQNTCELDHDVGCICPDGFYMNGEDCVPEEDCGCYLAEEQAVIPEGETYINAGCNRAAVCINGRLTRNDQYECSPDAVCEERDGVRKCYCNRGHNGNGEICTAYGDCLDLYNAGFTWSGIYSIKPTNWHGFAFSVYCNMSNGGGWTVFQRRMDGSADFYLNWQSYRDGFGDLNGEHWMGNEKLHYLTNQKRYKVRIDLVNRDHEQYYAEYDYFRIDDEAGRYRLSGLGTYSGNADERSNADGRYLLTVYHNNPFSTVDMDNDGRERSSMAVEYRSAWWYGDDEWGYTLNGQYEMPFFQINYLPGPNYLYFSEMKIRPV